MLGNTVLADSGFLFLKGVSGSGDVIVQQTTIGKLSATLYTCRIIRFVAEQRRRADWRFDYDLFRDDLVYSRPTGVRSP